MPHILVVDDDADLLELMKLVLEKSNYQVTSLDDGNKVVSALEEVKPDLILMDIYLGTSDGRSISRSLKTTERFNGIPIILYSAGNIPAQSIMDSLADSFISKPFNNAEVLEQIQ